MSSPIANAYREVASILEEHLFEVLKLPGREAGEIADRMSDDIAAIRDTGGPGYIGCASAVRDMSQTGILHKIDCPTLVVIGAEDPACTPAQGEVLHENITGSRKIVLEDAAHLSNIEKPAEFNAAVLEFLRGVA